MKRFRVTVIDKMSSTLVAENELALATAIVLTRLASLNFLPQIPRLEYVGIASRRRIVEREQCENLMVQ
jgi:hypothetical protein